jgi:hypothetical protein
MREIVIAFVIVILVSILFWNIMPKRGDTIVINCSLSEISPDFTPAMKQACRDARRNGL